MKICVYAICKNEEKFVERWFNSAKDADGIFVLDTGSTDNSVKKLKKLGVKVKTKEIIPWRFDDARNESLKMIPNDYDLCVCLDLDEVLLPGWYENLKKIYSNDYTRVRYIYNWALDIDNKPVVWFYGDKIHRRKGFTWINPVHEVLKCDDDEKMLSTDKVIINHYPDSKKSRSSYLPLLELATKENPLNDRSMHYLGREYMFYKRWNDAIDTLEKHLRLKSATWLDERCASMRFIARCYKNLNRIDEAIMWADKAIKEAPYLRDGYMEKALITYDNNDFINTEILCKKALKINIKTGTYINEIFTRDLYIYDILSITCFYNKKYRLALIYINKALKLDPDNKRLIANKKIIQSINKK